MSRSYHVTEKAARVAFANGDIEPMYQASEKSWVKKSQKELRAAQRIIPEKKRVISRHIVSHEKRRTSVTKTNLKDSL